MWQSFAAPNLSTESTFILARVGRKMAQRFNSASQPPKQGKNLPGGTEAVSVQRKLSKVYFALLLFFAGVTISLTYPWVIPQNCGSGKQEPLAKKKGTGNAVSQVRQPNRLMDIAEMPELIE